MQTIITKYAGPTNTKGSRIIANCWLSRKITSWDHSLNVEENHKAAAQVLVNKLNQDRGGDLLWSIIAHGGTPDGKGYAFIIDLK